MSRSGYTDDMEDMWGHIRWRGAVSSAIRGERGQRFLRDLLAALDAMPEKRLVPNVLEEDGDFCALGVLGCARGIDLSALDPDCPEQVAEAFGIAPALAQEIVFENDDVVDGWDWIDVEVCGPIRPNERRCRTVRVQPPYVEEKRWSHMRAWVASQIKADSEVTA